MLLSTVITQNFIIYYTAFDHLLIGGHSGYFQFGTISHHAARKILVHGF